MPFDPTKDFQTNYSNRLRFAPLTPDGLASVLLDAPAIIATDGTDCVTEGDWETALRVSRFWEKELKRRLRMAIQQYRDDRKKEREAEAARKRAADKAKAIEYTMKMQAKRQRAETLREIGNSLGELSNRLLDLSEDDED